MEDININFSASPSSSKKRKVHRACDYCREHRIKCVYETPELCKHCLDYEIDCTRVAPPPKDNRPRKRTMTTVADEDDVQGLEPLYLGGSSLTQLFWLFCPPSVKRKLHALDVEFDLHRGAVCDNEEQGLLVGRQPCQSRRDRALSMTVQAAQAKLAETVGAESVLNDLYDSASLRIITVCPVVSKHESLLTDEPDDGFYQRFVEIHHNSCPPTPLPRVVRLIHCALAAMSREVPGEIRQSVLSTLRNVLSGSEMDRLCRSSSIASIQVLVLLGMCDDLHREAGGTPWLRLGVAIRMAQELALHRNVSLDLVPLAQRNRRTRVWGACVAADRWTALRQGQSLMIDLDMCDVSVPQEYPDHVRDGSTGRWCPAFRFHAEITKLSILLGRVYQLTGTPKGLLKADDTSLLILQTEIDIWISQLPMSWPYSSQLETPEAGELMNIFYVAVEFTFLRPFLWPTIPIPPHLVYRPPPQRWSILVNLSQRAINWTNSAHGAFYLDVWSNVLYCLVCCMFINLKLHQQTIGSDGKTFVEIADQVIQQWASLQPDSNRRSRIAGMSRLLRESTGTATSPISPVNAFTPGGSLSETWLEAVMGSNDINVMSNLTGDSSEVNFDFQV